MKNKNGFSLSFWFVVLIIILITFNPMNMKNIMGQKKLTYSYSDFLDQVKKGTVSSVVVSRKDDGLNDVL
jgi:ATP-dependent Zn protease